MMWRTFIACAALAVCWPTMALDVRCSLGALCIDTQGTRIRSKEVLSMLESCDDFTRSNVGARVLRMTSSEIMKASNNKVNHPLAMAEYAWHQLRDSPLKFDRKEPNPATMYASIRQACARLHQDFDNEAKWSR